VHGSENFAVFPIGNDRAYAYGIFEQLKGSHNINEKDFLFIDFIETKEGLPLNLKMISCSLSQLAQNCCIITKELFKLKNLEEHSNKDE